MAEESQTLRIEIVDEGPGAQPAAAPTQPGGQDRPAPQRPPDPQPAGRPRPYDPAGDAARDYLRQRAGRRPEPEEFDAALEARKRLEREGREQQVREEMRRQRFRERAARANEQGPGEALDPEAESRRGRLRDLLGVAGKLGVPGARTAGRAAETLGGAGGGLLGGAGGVAAGLGIGWAVSAGVAAGLRQAGRFAEQAGTVGTSLAGNDNRGAITQAGNAVAELAGHIPILGSVVQAEIGALNSFREAVDKTTAAFIQRGRELARYSPELTLAGARADIRQRMGDVREAQRLGPDIANLTELRSRQDDELRKMLEPIKELIAKDLMPVLNVLAHAVTTGLVAPFSAIADGLLGLQKAIGEGDWKTVLKNLADLSPAGIGAAITGAVRKAHEKDYGKANFDKLIEDARQLGIGLHRRGEALQQLAGQQVNAPIRFRPGG